MGRLSTTECTYLPTSAVGEGYPQETRLQAPKRLC